MSATVPLIAALVALVGVASAALTALMRRYAARRDILDRPNHRSAHRTPMPRGGGVALVGAILGGAGLAVLIGWASPRIWFAMAGGLLVAAVGWMDDVRGASVRLRLFAQVAAALWAMYWLEGIPFLQLGGDVVSLGGFGTALGVLGIVWAINLYNFMDGLDGFAGTEALMTAGAGGLLLAWAGFWPLALMCFIVSAASAGFLVWNWPPAKIFMGDVGSGFLGYTLAVLAVASERSSAVPLVAWLIVFGAFVFDATVTLVRRLVRGEVIYSAHFEHAYQRAASRPRTHAAVGLALVVINLALAGLAVWSVARPGHMLLAAITAIGLLTLIYLYIEVFEARLRS